MRFSLQKLVHAALSLALLICGGAVGIAAPPAENSYVASLRRLTEQEYRNSIADIFGKEIEVRGSFEPTVRTNGLEAISTGLLSTTPVGFESLNKIADDVANLHSDKVNINKETALDEKGNRVNARGDKPNKHDILTGSQLDGTAYPAGEDMTCRNWTVGNSTTLPGKAQIGHHDRESKTPGVSPWNSAHATRGCGQEDLKESGGDGLIYCFATK